MEDHILYLLLGSNLGNREEFLTRAIHKIREQIGVVQQLSSVYESAPWGFRAETNFLNRVISVITRLSPEEVLLEILGIENESGRIRTREKYESRTLDIDILFYDKIVLNEETLQIPHPKIEERRFVLVPLEEIAPDHLHPVNGQTTTQLLALCPDQGWVRKLNKSVSDDL
jgi:2-amino-4-hydroxy-6-hydroxymethyldihydropteridine diphosphokinase